jgi:hypothetical protein
MLPTATLLAFCDDFMVQYPPHYDNHEMAIQVGMTRIDVSKQRIELNSKLDKTYEGKGEDTRQDSIVRDIFRDKTNKSENKDKDNKASKNREQRKKNGSRDYFKVYRYQFGHYMMGKKRARRSASKRKTKDGKFLEGPAKDDGTYMFLEGPAKDDGTYMSSSCSNMGSVDQTSETQRTPSKVPTKTPPATRRWKKKRLKCRKVGKPKVRKRGVANQVVWAGQKGRSKGNLRQVPWNLVQVTFQSEHRVWDGERAEREGGGKAATATRFRIQ